MRLSILFLSIILVNSTHLQAQVVVGAENTSLYFPLLQSKKIALVANHTSMIGSKHLADSLTIKGFDIVRIFGPEHGFRGNASAGEKVNDTIDNVSGIRVVSLYGKNYKPKTQDLKDIDIVLFDIQDVGVRCYTYISTLHYVMEACAENNVELIVLDRPNPNGFYIAGPILDNKYRSFVGMHPVPLVYGMTIGEYAQMINGEHWLKDSIHCKLKVIPCTNYEHSTHYTLPIAPSPNLRTMNAIYHYPSLVLFEGTVINVGRGTGFPFEVYGHPSYKGGNIKYTPHNSPSAINPPHVDQLCNGIDLRFDSSLFTLKYLIDAYKNVPFDSSFFMPFFLKLAGNKELQNQIKSGMTKNEIVATWQSQLELFKKIREKHLIYPDF